MWFCISAIVVVGLLGVGFAMARSWAVWYLEQEAAAERAAARAIAVKIQQQEAAALRLTYEAAAQYLVATDIRYLRPPKASKVIAAAHRTPNPRAYIRNRVADGALAGRYCAWRGTQTSRRQVSTDILEQVS